MGGGAQDPTGDGDPSKALGSRTAGDRHLAENKGVRRVIPVDRGVASLFIPWWVGGYDYDWSWWESGRGTPRPPKACYDGVISGAPSTPLDAAALQKRFPQLRENFLWLDAHFIRANVSTRPVPGPGPPNTKLTSHFQRLVEGNIAETSPRRHPPGGRWMHSAFCVPKKKPGELRFILACKSLNAALRHIPLPSCKFPSFKEITDMMLNGNFFVEFDFKSYFIQFLLAPETRDSSVSAWPGREASVYGHVAFPWDTGRRRRWARPLQRLSP